MPLAPARIHQFSMSRVMPRSWPTTMPGVMTSTAQPRSASSSATDVAWWKPISSSTTTSPVGLGPALEHVAHVDDPVGVARRPPRAGGAGAGGDDHTVGSAAGAISAASTVDAVLDRRRRDARHSLTWLRTRSPNSARLGTDAARRTWPPASASRSSTRDPVPVARRGDRRLHARRARRRPRAPTRRAGRDARRRRPRPRDRSAGSRCSPASG